MPVLAEKIRSGLVELRTKDGLVYLNPAFSERLYLLWIFRNFHRLPVQVLNRHQRQLIERLAQTSVVAKQGPVPRTSLIGSVENIEIARVSEAKAAAGTRKVVSMSPSLTFMDKAAGSEAISGLPRRLRLPQHLIHFPEKSRSTRDLSPPETEADAQTQTQAKRAQARRFPQILLYPGSRRSLGISLFVACCLALMLFYSREERKVPSRPAPQAAGEARNPLPISSLSASIAEPGKVPPLMAAQHTSAAKPMAVDSMSSQPFLETHVPGELRKSIVATAPPVSAAPPDTAQRPHTSEWPAGGFSYPIAPSPNLTGTVLLKAIIGIHGTVTRVEIVSGNRTLASAAAEAVWHWRYPPHNVNGIPTEAETNIAIDFRGDDAVSITFPAM